MILREFISINAVAVSKTLYCCNRYDDGVSFFTPLSAGYYHYSPEQNLLNNSLLINNNEKIDRYMITLAKLIKNK